MYTVGTNGLCLEILKECRQDGDFAPNCSSRGEERERPLAIFLAVFIIPQMKALFIQNKHKSGYCTVQQDILLIQSNFSHLCNIEWPKNWFNGQFRRMLWKSLFDYPLVPAPTCLFWMQGQVLSMQCQQQIVDNAVSSTYTSGATTVKKMSYCTVHELMLFSLLLPDKIMYSLDSSADYAVMIMCGVQ